MGERSKADAAAMFFETPENEVETLAANEMWTPFPKIENVWEEQFAECLLLETQGRCEYATVGTAQKFSGPYWLR